MELSQTKCIVLVSRMRETSLIRLRILLLLFHWTFGEAGGAPLLAGREVWYLNFPFIFINAQHSTIMEKSSTGACCSTTSLPLVGLTTRFTQKHTGYTDVNISRAMSMQCCLTALKLVPLHVRGWRDVQGKFARDDSLSLHKIFEMICSNIVS